MAELLQLINSYRWKRLDGLAGLRHDFYHTHIAADYKLNDPYMGTNWGSGGETLKPIHIHSQWGIHTPLAMERTTKTQLINLLAQRLLTSGKRLFSPSDLAQIFAQIRA